MHTTLTKQLTGDVTRADLCSAAGCGLPRHLHYDTTGDGYVGCTCAAARAQLGLYEDRRSHVVEGSDLYPDLTRVILATLQCDSGAVLTGVVRALGREATIQIARNLARRVMAEYQATRGRI